MNVDNDFDQHLLNQFSCLSTTERADLVKQLQELFANCHVNDTTATFFLDMNNWNLQAAICTYIDFNKQDTIPNMKLVADCTIGGNEDVPPNTVFRKTWQILNDGDVDWQSGTRLQFLCGTQMSERTWVPVPALKSSETCKISVILTSPSDEGVYFNTWQLVTPSGTHFGELIAFGLNVVVGGTLALTQQLHELST